MPSGKATSHDGATNPKAILGLLAASFAFLVLFTSSAVPIPLYSEYRASIGLTDAAISVAMVSYLIGVCGVLFVAGSVSDAIGYRATAVIGLLLGIGGCLLFSQVKSVPMLFAARFCQGLSCGIAMSAISAWVVDVAKGRFLVVATTIAGCGALVGVMIGSIAIGVFCAVSSNYAIMYYIVAALMALGIVFVLCAPEPPHARVRLRAAIRPITKIDPAILPVFPVAATAYLAAWIIGTYYQSFSAIVALDCFGMAAPIVGSCILALSMAPSAFGGPVEARMRSGLSLRVSMVALVATTALMCLFMALEQFAAFLLATGAFGMTTGMCLSGSLRLLLAKADGDTAHIVSTINLVGYVGCTIASLAMGASIDTLGLLGVLIALLICGIGAVGIVFAKTKNA